LVLIVAIPVQSIHKKIIDLINYFIWQHELILKHKIHYTSNYVIIIVLAYYGRGLITSRDHNYISGDD